MICAHDMGHFIETTMGLSMIHEQQIGLNWKSMLFAINNSTKCISTNSHVIFFLQSAARYLNPELLERVCLQSPSMWASALERQGGGEDLLIKSFHQEGPNTVFPLCERKSSPGSVTDFLHPSVSQDNFLTKSFILLCGL